MLHAQRSSPARIDSPEDLEPHAPSELRVFPEVVSPMKEVRELGDMALASHLRHRPINRLLMQVHVKLKCIELLMVLPQGSPHIPLTRGEETGDFGGAKVEGILGKWCM